MSRDYKTPVHNNAKKSVNPLLIGLILGVLLGFLLAGGTLAIFTNLLKPFDHKNHTSTLQSRSAPVASKSIEGEAQQTDNPKLDFYTILPEKTVTPSGQPSATIHSSSIMPPSTTVSLQQKSTYLQAGAYKSRNEANDIKARLALLGVESSIETVSLPDGSIWHRVRIGPINSLTKLKTLQQLLSKNSIATTIIKKTQQTIPPG
ncbi:MAG: SPOR domain-containing protein [Pseudomonadota bacterium]|nr:SPOR domain-containing protein [Pseudomonadota bacterium]